MMIKNAISRDEVVERISKLHSFPLIVTQLLATMEDPEINLKILVKHIEHDPLIAARVLSRANRAGLQSQNTRSVRDIFTATSLIGTTLVRDMAIIGSIVGLFEDLVPVGLPVVLMRHSIDVGVCSEELALATTTSASAALVAGLLHDVGQLCLYRKDPGAFRMARDMVHSHHIGIEKAENEVFGVDHAMIGAWIAESWSLPTNIVAAIRHHHLPDPALDEPLVPIVHIAEVLTNALDLTSNSQNSVTNVSSAACQALGLTWSDDVRPILGRIEARSRHAHLALISQPRKTKSS
jgi:putative nucleotidyltransferase with HDIG domain